MVSRLIVAVIALFVASCSAGPPLPPTAALGSSAQATTETDYRLGSADKVRITVFNLSLPLIGSVSATGSTTAELGQRIQTRLADGYLRDPKVSIDVLTYRPYYILGEVNQPGEYPFSARLTVINAVATAKGFTYRANQGRVFVKSAGSSVEREVPLSSDLLVQPGDTLRFGERYF
jgi:polysaccharide export outer membrane protein